MATSRLDPYPIRAVHLIALWAYGVTQPIFSFVSGNPELLALRGATRTEVTAFAVLLGLVPPLAVAVYAWMVSRVSRWAGDMLFLGFLGVFSAPLAFQLVTLVDPSELLVAVAVLALTTAAVVAYARWRAVRLFLAFSLVLPIAGFAAFLRGTPVAVDTALAARAPVASPAPVVLVVLDELPLSSLMTGSEEIDALRYPNFATLAREGTWYPSATTVFDATAGAVPAILTGRTPREDALPVVADYPENLFSLLGRSYSLEARERYTSLCPRRFCPRGSDSVVDRVGDLLEEISALYVKSALPGSGATPDIGARLWNESLVSRTDEFEIFLRGFGRGEPLTTLHYMHPLLPHAPYEFLPSGRTYRHSSLEGGRNDIWGRDAWLVLQGYQRHLLQLEYTDALLGRLLRRLQSMELYDSALVVVVADHGVSFRAGDGRRPATETNFADIANVPLFVKYPHQRDGRIDSRAARTVDILPTIADVLGVRLPWRVGGTSLLSRPPTRDEAAVTRVDGATVSLPMSIVKRQRQATVSRKEASFGRGRDSLYGIGMNTDLIGSQVASAPQSTGIRVRIQGESALRDTRTSSDYVPARISSVVEEGEIGPDVELAVAVNGRIRALTRCSMFGDTERCRAIVPESAFREGSNSVEIFAIEVRNGTRRLVRLGGTPF